MGAAVPVQFDKYPNNEGKDEDYESAGGKNEGGSQVRLRRVYGTGM